MKITIDKHFTTLDKVDRTKEQMKEFKAMYTDGDLLRMFSETVDNWDLGFGQDIIYCNLEAFPGGSAETDETHYHVEMLTEKYNGYNKISFYISQSGEIDTRPHSDYQGGTFTLYSVKHYEETK